jgi:hypothetical protein
VAILLIANAVFVWTTDARLERQLADIKAAGDPLTLADLAPKPIPPEKNAAAYFRQATSEETALENEIEQWIEAQPEFGLYLAEMLQFSKEQVIPEKMHKAMKAIYAAHPNLVPSLEKAVECPDYDAQLDYSTPPEQLTAQLLPIVQNARGITRVFAYRARLAAIDGNCDEAARMALATFKLTRHIERNPSLVSYLVALAIRSMAAEEANFALQTGPLSKELRQALDAELANQERIDGYVWAIKSGRAYEIDSFNRFPLRNFWLYSRGRWNRKESQYLDAAASYLALPPDGRPSKPVVDDLYSLAATHSAMTKVRAMVRCLRVLNALQIHVQAGNGEAPKLIDLGLPAETTADPYLTDPQTRANPPLHVKKTSRGWIVYSVGPNGQDDGGMLEDPRNGDIGVGPPIPAVKAGEPAKK